MRTGSPPPMTRTPSVRRFLAEEWRTYKALRLGALADSPDAFGATLAGERIRSDAEWADRLGSGMDERWNLPLLAEMSAEPIGLAWGRIVPSNSEIASLYQMWVAPTHRGFGAGALLLEAVVTWARTRGAHRVVLSVACGESPARRLYLRAGFAPFGEPEPLWPGSHLLSQPMELVLSHDAA